MAAIMPDAVADHEIGCPKHHIVSDYLLEYSLRDRHIGGFVFDYGERTAHAVKKHGIAAFEGAVEPQ